MNTLRCLSILALGVALLSLPGAYCQTKNHQVDTSGIDSFSKYCKEVILKNCSGCHGENGQGDAGPNLTDKHWLDGGGIKNINNTIRDGVAGKGMIGWDAVFSPQELQQISACVLSLQGTKPAKAKKPEGELYDDQKNRPNETTKKQQ